MATGLLKSHFDEGDRQITLSFVLDYPTRAVAARIETHGRVPDPSPLTPAASRHRSWLIEPAHGFRGNRGRERASRPRISFGYCICRFVGTTTGTLILSVDTHGDRY